MARGVSTTKGTYLLLAGLEREVHIQVGRLGMFEFAAGWYSYAGSALGPGGLQARLARHERSDKRLHWHIDYLYGTPPWKEFGRPSIQNDSNVTGRLHFKSCRPHGSSYPDSAPRTAGVQPTWSFSPGVQRTSRSPPRWSAARRRAPRFSLPPCL